MRAVLSRHNEHPQSTKRSAMSDDELPQKGQTRAKTPSHATRLTAEQQGPFCATICTVRVSGRSRKRSAVIRARSSGCSKTTMRPWRSIATSKPNGSGPWPCTSRCNGWRGPPREVS
jgi:hypothetical protein